MAIRFGVAVVPILLAPSAQAQKTWNPGIATPSAVELHRERQQARVSPVAIAALVTTGAASKAVGLGGQRAAAPGRRLSQGKLDVARTDASVVPPTMPHHPVPSRWTKTPPLDPATAAAAGLTEGMTDGMAGGLSQDRGLVTLRPLTAR